jgi:hypothetical protein
MPAPDAESPAETRTAPDEEPADKMPAEPAEAVADETRAARPPLDLSMPRDPYVYELYEDEYARTDEHDFDAAALFNKKEPNDLSIMVAPSFKESEDPAEPLPEIDGGSVSVEVKTP